jgi:hypothetical protein
VDWDVPEGDPPDAGVTPLDVEGSPASVRLEKVAK